MPALQALHSLSGVWRRLQAWKLHWRRGRVSVTSPDPEYASKLARIAALLTAAQAAPVTGSAALHVLYADEFTCFRQPPVHQAWHAAGSGGQRQKRARWSTRANTRYRYAAALDWRTGQVYYRAQSRVGVKQLREFLRYLRRRLGEAGRIVLLWDNWPIHYYDLVQAEAQQQRIELVYLPTYAPWTNPVEKLWRKLKEEVLAMHDRADDWDQLKQAVRDFLDGYDRPAPDLRQYVGLPPLPLPD